MFINPKHNSTTVKPLPPYNRRRRRYLPRVSDSPHRKRWIATIKGDSLSYETFYRISNSGSIGLNKRVTLSLYAFIATKDRRKFYQLCHIPTTKLSVRIESIKYLADSSNVVSVKGTIQNRSIDSNLYIDSDVAAELGIDNSSNKVIGFIPCIGTKIQFYYDASNKRRSKFKGVVESYWLEGRVPVKQTPPEQLIQDPSLD